MNKYYKYFLVLILIFIVVVIAMNFFGPTIGGICSHREDFCLADFVAGYFSCSKEWIKGLPTGRMVVIVPKNLYFGKQNEMIGFAYSSSQFSSTEIAEKIRQFLDELNLDEHETHLVEFNILMDISGYPNIYINRCNNWGDIRYATGENLYIDPEGLTIWHLTYPLDGFETTHGWEADISLYMAHDDPEITDFVGSSQRCSYICSITSGSASEHVEIEHTIRTWIEAVWFYYPPFGLIFFLSVITLIVYTAGIAIWKLKIKNHP